MLKEYIKNICINLLNELSLLKEKIDSESILMNKLDTITHLKNQLTHILSKNKYIKKVELKEVKNNNLLTLSTTDNQFTIKIKNNILFFIDTKNKELNNLLIKKINQEKNDNLINKIEEYLNYYYDYENTKCDECLSVKNNKEEFPFIKIINEGILLSFHENCFNKLN